MHLRTHVRDSHRGRFKHGDSEYIDGMLEHDDTIGGILKALDDMGVADNTVVVYTSDNGPHMNTWPDGAMTWFRSERNVHWLDATNRDQAFAAALRLIEVERCSHPRPCCCSCARSSPV